MQHPVHALLLVTKPGQDDAQQTAREVQLWLREREVRTLLVENSLDQDNLELNGFVPDAALVLGGDGTLLAVARKLRRHQIPLLGINLGHVGFLTEIEEEDWHPSLEQLLAQQGRISQRMALEFDVKRGDRTIHSGWALNDVVVNRGRIARLIGLDISIDSQPVGPIRADGIVVATPTGTTAYAVSAGGPLVHPELEAICMTPICPFMSHIRPMVLAAGHRIRIDITSHSAEACLTLDGQVGFDLLPGDAIHLQRSAFDARFINLHPKAYLDKLHSKGYF